jgi:hypothetical protein
MDIPDLVRARVIELFREPVAYLCNNLERHFVDQGLPLSPKGRKTALLTRALHSELAAGYKIIIERLLRGDAKRFDEKLMVVALHRAISYLSEVLYRSALVYEPWPAGVWREMHSMYVYASQNKVHAVPVKDSLATQSRNNTIEKAYRRALLFATMNPLRLRQAEIRRLHQETDTWAPFVEVRAPTDDLDPTGLFSFDVWGDMPPIAAAQIKPPLNRRTRIVDVRPLVHELREHFDDAPLDTDPSSDKDHLSRPLLRQLISGWVKPPQRRYVRTHLNFDLDLVAGLTAVHQAISGNTIAASHAAARPRSAMHASQAGSPRVPAWAEVTGESLSLAPPDSRLLGEPVLRDPRLSGESLTSESETAIDWTTKPGSASPPVPYSVQTFNESAGGYCIRWPSEHASKVRVGELLGVRTASDEPRFAVGAVRWLKQDPDRDLEIGVEILSSRCQPGELSLGGKGKDSRSPSQARFPCLLLPESQNGARDTSLLTSAPSLEVGATFGLLTHDERRRIQLVRVMESTGNFTRYEFRLVSSGEPEKKHPGDDRGFDDLWSTL